METLNATQDPITLVWCPHPVAPVSGRDIRVVAAREGATLREYLLDGGINPHQLITIQIDGRPVPLSAWDVICPLQGQFITAQAALADGGGGDGGSNPIATIAAIGLMIAAPYMAGYLMTGTWVAATSTAGLFLAAGISIAGNLLIGAIFPPHQPALANVASVNQPSPTYSLSGGSNSLRPYEAMPVVFGRHRIFPDFGAKPYTELSGDEQYLFVALNFGLADVVLSDLRIGDTSLDSFEGVTLYWADEDTGVMSGFPGNVDTTNGAALTYAAGWVQRTSAVDTVQLAIDIEGALYAIDTNGNPSSLSVEIQAEYRAVGDTDWLPFFVSLEGSVPQAAYVPPSAGSISSVPDYLGTTAPNYTVNATNQIILSNASMKPVRKSYRLDVDAGQYEVRVSRLTADFTDSRTVGTLNFTQLRSYQQDNTIYAGERRLGLRIKASGQINGGLQQVSALAEAQCDYWDGADWQYGGTQNPAWWFLNFARGRRDDNNLLLYGCGLGDSAIDIEALKDWAVFCDTWSLTFDAVLDQSMSCADWLNAICRCGLASPSWSTGKLGVVWDAVDQPVAGTVNMGNILRDTFQVQYLTERLADEIAVTYVNPDNGWQQDTVRALAYGVTTPQRTSTVDLLGCTNADMAGIFANAQAAAQYYRRRRVSWEMDFEGFVWQRGDIILLSHDLTQWGYSGRVVEFVDSTHVQLDRSVPRTGEIEYLCITKADGSFDILDVVAGTVDTQDDTLTLAELYIPDSTRLAMDNRWTFSPLATPGKKVKIVSVSPTSERQVKIIATDEDTAYYAAWNGTYTAATQQTVLRPSKASITAVTATETLVIGRNGDVVSSISVNWTQTGNYFATRARYRFNGGTWHDLADIVATNLTIETVETGQMEIEIAPYNATGQTGGKGTAILTVNGKSAPPGAVEDFTVIKIGGEARAQWALHADLDVRVGGFVVVRYAAETSGAEWENGVIVDAFPGGNTSGPLPLMTGTYMSKSLDSTGHWSEEMVSFVATEGMVTGFTTIASIDQSGEFAGTKTNTAVLSGALRLSATTLISEMLTPMSEWGFIGSLGGVVSTGTYDFDAYIDLSSVATRRFETDIAALCFDTNDFVGLRGLVSAWDSVGGDSINDCDATLYIATTNDDPAGSPTWSEWQPFFVGDFTCRAAKFKLGLASGNPTHNIKISTIAVDVKIPA